MELILTEVCEYLNNYFWDKKIQGTFTISGGNVVTDKLKDGQYFRIVGSVFNDGVHLNPSGDLTDETFTGEVWAMAVPSTVIAIANDIHEWQEKYGKVTSEAMSPFNSESFAGYSYSKSGNANGYNTTWQDVFGGRLNKYRKLRGIR